MREGGLLISFDKISVSTKEHPNRQIPAGEA